MSFASTVHKGEMDTYESQLPATAEDCFEFHLERWSGCACQSSKSLLNTMCNQDYLRKSSDGTEEDDRQTDWSEADEENSSGTTGM